ncbi:hypothetical protein [Brevundimonas sp.]|uniref:hypothetical protein n=1 Tax=Brevundimonas sp. TaxID=1871086 RepID=UPI003562C187
MLFLESSEEAPQPTQVKRWIRNYGAQGVLQRLSALLLARPASMDADGQAAQEQAILQALDEYDLATLPVIGNLDFGHTDPITTLPYGAEARLDCATGEIVIRP